MVPWRGRVSFRIFIPSKPIRYGMKLYMCCESESSYVSGMELYTGKKGDKREVDDGPNVVKKTGAKAWCRLHSFCRLLF